MSYERQVMIYDKNLSDRGTLSMWDVYFNPIDANLDNDYKTLMSPLENGIKHLDHKVAELIKIDVVGYVYIDGVDQFYELAREKTDTMDLDKALCTVATKGGTYDNCILVGIKENDEQDKFDVVKFTLSFIQIDINDISYASGTAGAYNGVANKNNDGNSDTKFAGLMGSSPVVEPSIPSVQESILSQFYNGPIY